MLAMSGDPFDDPRSIFQVKWDGVRALTSVSGGKLRIWGREGADYSDRYPELNVLLDLPDGTMLDGEFFMVRGGVPDFHALMSRHGRRPRRAPYRLEPIRYVVFDLLYHAGQSLLNEPLSHRLDLLKDLLPQGDVVEQCKGIVGKGRKFFESTIAAGHEGVVAKKLAGRYQPNQRGWTKVKQKLQLPCVVIGYRMVRGELHALAMATLVDGAITFVGCVELGIDRRPNLAQELKALHRNKPVVPCKVSAQWGHTFTLGAPRSGVQWIAICDPVHNAAIFYANPDLCFGRFC